MLLKLEEEIVDDDSITKEKPFVHCKGCKAAIPRIKRLKYQRISQPRLCDSCATDTKSNIRRKIIDYFTKEERLIIKQLVLQEYGLFE